MSFIMLMVSDRLNMSQKQICLYSILASFFCFRTLVFITTFLILRRKNLISGHSIKTSFDKYIYSKKKNKNKNKTKKEVQMVGTRSDDVF